MSIFQSLSFFNPELQLDGLAWLLQYIWPSGRDVKTLQQKHSVFSFRLKLIYGCTFGRGLNWEIHRPPLRKHKLHNDFHNYMIQQTLSKWKKVEQKQGRGVHGRVETHTRAVKWILAHMRPLMHPTVTDVSTQMRDSLWGLWNRALNLSQLEMSFIFFISLRGWRPRQKTYIKM